MRTTPLAQSIIAGQAFAGETPDRFQSLAK